MSVFYTVIVQLYGDRKYESNLIGCAAVSVVTVSHNKLRIEHDVGMVSSEHPRKENNKRGRDNMSVYS